uniref:Uncharacterized protein n=1 Tax=Anguilla anguilla TaxID=7936 RepID=A0A0E9R104_ANGAN
MSFFAYGTCFFRTQWVALKCRKTKIFKKILTE